MSKSPSVPDFETFHTSPDLLPPDTQLLVPDASSTLPELCAPELPIYNAKDDIAAAITHHSAVIIKSPFGTGKSTQVPKIALQAGFDLIRETQPRRRAALNVGERILHEMGVVLGREKAGELIHWQTGAGLVGQRGTPISVVTEGVLLRQEAYRPSKGTNEIWLLDEVHERGEKVDKLMGYAKEKRATNPDFTVVMMTATPNMHQLVDFMTDQYGQEPAVIELTAPMYPVEYRERPQSDMIKEILRATKDIHDNPDEHGGSNVIQVFESGEGEINHTIEELYERLSSDILAKTTILPNYAKLSRREQDRVYLPVDGIKIVVQTNIGKTSNTIPGTRYVVTRGKERQMRLDEEGHPFLVEVDISQDCIGQQGGRTGRTSSGIVVVTTRKGEKFVPMSERPMHMEPEIKHTPLDETALYLAYRGDSIRTFEFPDAPDQKSVERAINRMKALGALDDKEQITEIGRQMFAFAASPEGQRCMVESLKYPQHIRLYMAAITAMAECGGLRQFMVHDADWDQVEELSDESNSDLLSSLEVFIKTKGKSLKELNGIEVSIDGFLRVDELLSKLATGAGVSELAEMKLPSQDEREILRQCILAGYANNIYVPAEKDKSRGRDKTLFKALGRPSLLREISNRSVVSPWTNRPVVGTLRTLEVYEKGKAVALPIIEHVTTVTWQEIANLGLSTAEWQDVSFRPRGDKFVVTQEHVLDNQILDVREVPAEPGPRLRAAIIEHVKNNPGKSLLYLYKIKSDIEALAHKSRLPIKKFTQDNIDAIIESLVPGDITSHGHAEELLREYIVEKQLSLEVFVTKEEQQNILRNAPAKLNVGDIDLKVSYRQGRPLVYVRNRIDFSVYGSLPSTLQLKDGRDVLFVYEESRLTSAQFQNKLRTQGLL